MALSPELVLPTLLKARAVETPGRLYAQEVGGRDLTYAEAHAEVMKWAVRWRGAGVGTGDTALVMLPTGFDAIAAWLGLGWLRAIEVPVNTAYQGNMLRYIIANSRARTMLVHWSYLPRLQALASEGADLGELKTVIVHGRPGHETVDLPYPVVDSDQVTPADVQELPAPQPHDIATILYTSGTTGPSKGVLVPWAQIHATCTGSLPIAELSPEDAYYSPFPLFHISGKGPVYSMALTGGRLVLRERFDTASFWGDIAAYNCSTTLLLGAMANFIYRQPPRADDAATPLRNVSVIPLIPEIEEFKRRFGVRVSTVFNMTEVSCPVTSGGWTLVDHKSCGRVRDGYQVRVVDEWDHEVAPGELGELVVRSDEPWTLMAGYWGMPEKTVEAWRNQWLHTGDAFIRDEEGNFYFVDRQKDAIRRRGENISSMEVESEVNAHPAVLESAAIAVPSDWGEEEVKVVVVVKPGHDLSGEELWRFLTDRAPKFMVPRYIEFVEQLPKTPTEKVRKTELRSFGVTDATWDAQSHRP